MAIDTRNKRASAINISCPWRGLLPEPDGALEGSDMAQVAFMYSGFGAVAVVAGAALLSKVSTMFGLGL